MPQLMTKRIPVSEERWKELGRIKEAGQTYDALLSELIQAHKRTALANKARAAKQGKGSWTNLEDV